MLVREYCKKAKNFTRWRFQNALLKELKDQAQFRTRSCLRPEVINKTQSLNVEAVFDGYICFSRQCHSALSADKSFFLRKYRMNNKVNYLLSVNCTADKQARSRSRSCVLRQSNAVLYTVYSAAMR